VEKKNAIIIDPTTVIEDFTGKTCEEQIEICGRLCYKSEHKITQGSALDFVKKMIKDRHNAVMEMATMTFFLDDPDYFLDLEHWEILIMKYLVIDDYKDGLLITGSIRGFREVFFQLSDDSLIKIIALQIWKKSPVLFCDYHERMKYIERESDVNDEIVVKMFSDFELEELRREVPWLYFRHKFVPVRFIVNRAVTHELVRHRPCSFLQESQRYCRYANDQFGNRVTFIKPIFYEEGTEEYELWENSILQAEKTYLKLLKTSSPQASRTVLPNSCKTEIIIYCSLEQWAHMFHLRTSPAAEPSMQQVMTPLYEEFVSRFSGVEEMLKQRIPEGITD
jgi:thymidylate synthase (FAD)